MKLVAFGVILDDIVFPDGRTSMGVLGGGGPQTAWGAAAALGGGAEVGLVSGVGRDEIDLGPMVSAGVNLDGLRYNDLPTIRGWEVLEFDGKRRHLWRMEMSALPVQLERGWDVLPNSYRAAAWFHWGIHPGEADQDIAWATKLRAEGRKVSMEPFRPPPKPLDDAELRRTLAPLTVFSPNLYEAAAMLGTDERDAIVRRFGELGLPVLSLRRDAHGADLYDFRAGEAVHVDALPTTVVDPLGAGNAFCGALAARLDDGIAEAAAHAVTAASYLVEQVGIPPNLPTDYADRLASARAVAQSIPIP